MSDKLTKDEVHSLKSSVIDILDLYYSLKVPQKGETLQIQIKNDAQVCSFIRPVIKITICILLTLYLEC